MRLRAVLAAALVVGGLSAPHASAAPGEIVVTGSSTAYVDVITTTPLWFENAVVETSGRYGGVYVEQLSSGGSDNPPTGTGGFLAVRGLSRDPRDMRPFRFAGGGMFDPGVVRIHLLAERATTVRLQGPPDWPGMTLRPSRREHGHARVTDVRRVGDARSAEVPLPRGRHVVTAVAVQARGELARHADVDLCVREPAGTCPDHPGLSLGQDAGGAAASIEQEARFTGFWLARTAGDGLVASATVRHPRDLTHVRLAVFTLTAAR